MVLELVLKLVLKSNGTSIQMNKPALVSALKLSKNNKQFITMGTGTRNDETPQWLDRFKCALERLVELTKTNKITRAFDLKGCTGGVALLRSSGQIHDESEQHDNQPEAYRRG